LKQRSERAVRILTINTQPFHELIYQTAAPGGGIMTSRLPFLRGTVDDLPGELDALFAASDLQGLVGYRDDTRAPQLLGEAVVDELAMLAELGGIPPLERIGALLCGDLYVRPALDARGGHGDVRPVWRAFAQHCRWVAGVPGNHDAFGDAAELAAFAAEPGIHLLDGHLIEIDGFRIAGLGGIIGSKQKPGRRDERTYLRLLQSLLARAADLLLLHQGPDVPEPHRHGDIRIRAALDRRTPLLVMCGHLHWPTPLAVLGHDVQVVNLEARGILLQNSILH
jgi:Icc-related predicted phosphoesterase